MAFIKYKNADGNWESVETPGAIKYISQTLSEDQKEQARNNIDTYSKAEVDAALTNLGAQAKITGTPGDFVVIGDDGNVTTITLSIAEEGSY